MFLCSFCEIVYWIIVLFFEFVKITQRFNNFMFCFWVALSYKPSTMARLIRPDLFGVFFRNISITNLSDNINYTAIDKDRQ